MLAHHCDILISILASLLARHDRGKPHKQRAAACRSEAEPEVTGNPTYIDVVEIEQRGDEYWAVVEGNYPDACSTTNGTVQTVNGDTIHLTIYSQRPEDVACAQMLTPFMDQILLDTDERQPDEYTLIINENNAMASFTIS